MAGLTYAIADLHGRDDLLAAAFAAIAAHAGQRPVTIVTLGDYVDRGPQSRQVIERLIKGPPRPDDRLICLKGNHEEMMGETLAGPRDPSWWIGNGGDATLASYGLHPDRGFMPEIVPQEHLDWIAALPLTHADAHRVFVHAGVDPDRPLDGQGPDILLWKRYHHRDERGHGDLHVVHGHTPHESGPLLLEGRTALDTLAWATGRLVVAVFEPDRPGQPVARIEVRAAPHPEWVNRVTLLPPFRALTEER
jgi:serine/threonine protein phosphatase 1